MADAEIKRILSVEEELKKMRKEEDERQKETDEEEEAKIKEEYNKRLKAAVKVCLLNISFLTILGLNIRRTRF